MAEVAKLSIVPRRAEITLNLLNKLEELRVAIENKEVVGWSLVIDTGGEVKYAAHFEDRLAMLGALRYAEAKTASQS